MSLLCFLPDVTAEEEKQELTIKVNHITLYEYAERDDAKVVQLLLEAGVSPQFDISISVIMRLRYPQAIMIPTMVSHYRILQKLGSGGMGEIYLAQDLELGRQVAIKFLNTDSLQDETARKRLLREAQAAAKLDHRNICSVFEVGHEADQTFIVMAYVKGETLASHMQKRSLELSECISIGVQISEGLAEAHFHGIIHRDIKPQNIMITSQGEVKVMDFGLAKRIYGEQLQQKLLSTESRLTGTGGFLGTPQYMSPEQVRGELLDVRTDVFSLGVVLYEMISGHNPFSAPSVAETVSAILTKNPHPLSRYLTNVPSELERIVAKAIRKNCQERYQTIKDISLDLKSLQQVSNESAVGSPAMYSESSRFPWKMVIPSVVVILLILLLAFNFNDLTKRIHSQPELEQIDSIAVLPLVNLSNDPSQDYLADGMTETLITELARVKALKVISRTSVMQYKGIRKPLPDIAKELNVDAVVEGSLLRMGNQVRITAQLIHAASDRHLWAEQFDRDLGDVLSLQREVARTIVKQIGIELTSQEQTLLVSSRRANPKANEAYLKGLFYFNERVNESAIVDENVLLKRSFDYFQQAIQIEPDFAEAYAGLAKSYHWLASEGFPEYYLKLKLQH